MEYKDLLTELQSKYDIVPISVSENHDDEVLIRTERDRFSKFCIAFHEELRSPIMSMFASDKGNRFKLSCVFLGLQYRKWFRLEADIPRDDPKFISISRDVFSANFFERDIKEMFGIEPVGNPDGRRIRLHDEVWPKGLYPLRKDFAVPDSIKASGEYSFAKVEGEGVFEIPVGPVHAGIIGPGHFKFSVAGEPIIHLGIRLGFTHRGIEKLLEGKTPDEALSVAECVAGDSSVSHGWAFCHSIEKIAGISVPPKAQKIRMVLLELERMYCHVNDIGGIALDVGFSHPAALASIIKESIHQLNEKLTGSRFLKGVVSVGGVSRDIDGVEGKSLTSALGVILRDFKELKTILKSSLSFLDRVDTTGWLKKSTAEDIGVFGVAGRASGIDVDLRRDMPGIYKEVGFKSAVERSGDVLGRLNVRISEFEESANLIIKLVIGMPEGPISSKSPYIASGSALGYVEGWRGPVLYSTEVSDGRIERCKIVDPSFRNWLGLSYAMQDNIIPDFPVCNKSFDQSYPGNDL
jgi:Ni,Fe-hydrogenase III large subunit/Ni,Fe-hydrogenase III component G